MKYLIVFAFVAVASGQLPPFIKKCKFNDITFTKCFADNFPRVIPHLKDGIKELGVPPMTPYHLGSAVLDIKKDLKVFLKDVDIYRLCSVEFKGIQMDPASRHIKMSLFFDNIELLGKYAVQGNVFDMDIQGAGPANITLDDVLLDLEFNYPPANIQGQRYVQLTNFEYKYRVAHTLTRLENMFDGDVLLNEKLDRRASQRWKEGEDLMYPAVMEIIIKVLINTFRSVAASMPINALFHL